MPAFKPVPAGTQFGRLITIRDRALGEKHVMCRCACGAETSKMVYSLLSGATRSCGCLQREAVNSMNTTHGMTHSRAYIAFKNMHQRCYNPNRRQWKDWGGRGITVCQRWHDFENFHADMGDPPDGLSLDRVDNDAGYSPENCHWVTRIEQNSNRRMPVAPAEGWAKPNAQLTIEQVDDIRERYAAGGIKQRDLAVEYGIQQTQVSRIVTGVRWASDTPGGTRRTRVVKEQRSN